MLQELDDLTPRQKAERLEAELEQFPQVDCPVTHHFASGVYVREMRIPAGTVAVGAVHKTEHLTIIVGHCLLTTDDGPKEFQGYHVIRSKAGAKRAITTLADTIVTTIHKTDTTDLDALVEELTESSASELLGAPGNKQLLASGKQEQLA